MSDEKRWTTVKQLRDKLATLPDDFPVLRNDGGGLYAGAIDPTVEHALLAGGCWFLETYFEALTAEAQEEAVKMDAVLI